MHPYKNKRLKNPYFKPRKPQRSGHFYYNIFLLGIAILGWMYFLFCSHIFWIKDINIGGLQKYKNQEIEKSLDIFFNQRRFLFFKSGNIFIFNNKKLEVFFKDKYVFKNIKTEKIYPNKLFIYFEEQEQKFALYNNDDFYILSENSIVIKKEQGIKNWVLPEDDALQTTSTIKEFVEADKILKDLEKREFPPYPIFCDAYTLEDELGVGDRYPKYNYFDIIIGFIDGLHSKTEIRAKMAIVYKNKINPKIIIYTDNNWTIYLNNKTDGFKQFYKFYLIFNNEIKDTNKPLNYIDLRFGDRIYIK